MPKLRPRLQLFAGLFLLLFSLSRPAKAGAFLDDFPDLKQYVYQEPASKFYLGFGIAPIAILKSSVYITINLFQIHYLTRWIDWEVFSGSFGMTIAQNDYANARLFTFRSIPKFRFNHFLSIGAIAGYEFVSFPNLQSRLYKGDYFTPYEPFSSRGWIYGLALNETFTYGKYIFKAAEMLYWESYSTSHTPEGWTYYYQNNNLNVDSSPISASTVFMIEFSLLY